MDTLKSGHEELRKQIKALEKMVEELKKEGVAGLPSEFDDGKGGKSSFAEVIKSLKADQAAVRKAQAKSEMLSNAKCFVVYKIPAAWTDEKRQKQVEAAIQAAVPTHRRPVKLYSPTKKDGSTARIMIGECRNISDRQACVAALRENEEMKSAGVGARAQQSTQQEIRNRALISAIKFATSKKGL